MAFADALVGEPDAEVVMVDRRHRPGGHWACPAASIGPSLTRSDHPAIVTTISSGTDSVPRADARNLARLWAVTQQAVAAWTAEPDRRAWLATCRLNPLGNAGNHLAGPAMDALMRMLQHQDAAIDNLQRLLG